MKIIDENKTKYDSLMEFAILGKNNETISIKTLIATKKKKVNIKKFTKRKSK